MAYPIPKWNDNAVTVVQKRFVNKLRRRLTAAGLFAGKEFRVPDLGVRTLEWKETDDMSGATISMEIPALSPDSGPAYKTKSVEIPVITKDLHYDERDLLAAVRAGVDTVAADQAAWAMAKEMNTYLLFGNTGGPGEAKSILNHADVQTYAGGNWHPVNNADAAKTMVNDLNNAVKKLILKEQYGPYTLVMSPEDSEIWGSFVTNTSAQVRQFVPQRIAGEPIYDKDITAGDMYLINANGDNYDYVTPFGLGAVERRVKSDPVTGSLDIRFMMAGTPRVVRGDGVCKVTFTKV